MKKYFNKLSILIVAMGLSLSSCESLNLVPEDFPAEGNFWKNEAQISGYMKGLHSQLRGNYANFWFLGEARASTQRSGTSTLATSIENQAIKANTIDTDTPGFSNWVGFYRPIFDLNLFISRVEPVGEDVLTKDKKNVLLAQAYSLRAFYYFHLLRTYGGVPIETKPSVIDGNPDVTTYYTPRATYDQTLTFIKDDLSKADGLYASAAYPATGAVRESWNKAATKILIADVYLWSAKYLKAQYNTADLNKAMAALEEIPAGLFNLKSNYLDVFSYGNKGNSEIIMALNFSTTDGGNKFAADFVYATANLTSYLCYGADKKAFTANNNDTLNLKSAGWQRNEFSFKFFQAYDDKDLRKRGNFMDIYKSDAFTDGFKRTNTGTVLRKYLGTIDGTNRVYGDDYIIYRYADVILMKAEIKNALGQDPSMEINTIRERAYGNGNPYPVYSNSDFASNELAIYMERAKETPCEGKIWYDLIRMQQSLGGDPLVFSDKVCFYEDGETHVLDKAKQSHMLVWPIARGLVTNNPLIKPNPGYSQW